ncbi:MULTISPECIES: nitroreductase/quinone reductase family protein [Nocardia]|uniref:nitroreductase/quinone reductase family protein n=1 Tax=Nocardia TaxID=1817 RepID=UPI001E63DE2A|nr:MULTISPECIES: nitroreductase/quinone reductase family protein [Nocardia]
MVTDRQLRTINAIHRGVMTLSRGTLGTVFKGMPTIALTTIGRRSGRSHTVILTAPILDGDTIVIVASRGGAPTDPAWLHNLRANPAVEVSVKRGPVRPMIARELPSEERDELWREIVAVQPGYAAISR